MSAMQRSCRRALRLSLALVFALMLLPSAAVTAQSAEPGLIDATHYQSPQFGFAVSWQAPWQVAPGAVRSSPGSNDRLGLESGDATAQIVLLIPSAALDDLFSQIVVGVTLSTSDVQTLADERGDGIRASTVDLTTTWRGKEQRVRRYLELVDLTAENAGSPLFFLGAFGAPVDAFADAWTSFAANVTRAGLLPVFRGAPSLTTATPVADDGGSAGEIPPGVATYDDIGGQHDDNVNGWSEIPPVGGIHNNVWQKCQFYDKPINPGMAVHSLEHGAVWITFAPDIPKDQIDKIKSVANGQDYVLASPYPALPAPIVLTSWNHQLRLQSFDQAAIDQFIEVFKHSPTYTPEYGATCASGSTDTLLQ